MLGLLLLAQSVAVPAVSPPRAHPAVAPDSLTLVVADAIEQTDPQPLCAAPDCTSMFLGRFDNARVLAGAGLPQAFTARLEMGSPYISRYRLALIVEQRPGNEAIVHDVAGFNSRTGIACFDHMDTGRLGWTPTGAGITTERGIICVTE
ncbi:MAG: hypothetical protein ACK4SZ_10760 [Allosphingosinicella sp.]|uniref:hypothetical protein n=1 Tax=Allosphingosinicella sp. TaxID=2823234 RepID=UPI00395D9488